MVNDNGFHIAANLEFPSSKTKSKCSFIFRSQYLSGFVFMAVWSHICTSVSGGICWLSVDDQGMCSNLMEMSISREECCRRDHASVGWTEQEDYSHGDFFYLAYIKEQVPNCHTCHQTCDNIDCGEDKKCRVRNGQARCMCAPDCSAHSARQRGPVCGTDGNSYRSYCSLLKSNCRRGRQTQVDYYGRCRFSCDRVHCGDGESCVIDQNGIPHCIPCDINKRCPVVPGARKICGADGVTYPTMCHFQLATCRNGRSIGISYRAECDKSLTCDSLTCSSGQQCLWNSQSIQPQCVICNHDCHTWIGANRVCGTDDVTYDTWCHLQQEACSKGTVIQTKHYGRCGNNPSELTHGEEYESPQGDDAYFYAER